MKRVTVAILTYKRPDYLRRTLESFFKLNDTDEFSLIMLAQEKEKDTEKVIDKYRDRMHHVFYSGTNLGYTGGWNFLMRKAMKLGLPYVMRIENDYVSRESISDYLPELIKLMEKNGNIGYIRLKSPKQGVCGHNFITGKELKYRKIGNIGVGNGHYTFNPTLTKLSVIKEISPVTNENEAMRKYEKLGLEMGQLFADCFFHIGVGKIRVPGWH